MKFKFIENNEYEVNAYGPKKNNLLIMIEKLCMQDNKKIIGYLNNEIKEIDPYLVDCFITIDDKVYAVYKKEKYHVKYRLYELYDLLNDSYIYINQGCLANINRIDHFEVNISTALLVVFKSGIKEYVSRRRLKEVKERLGLKNEKKNF